MTLHDEKNYINVKYYFAGRELKSTKDRITHLVVSYKNAHSLNSLNSKYQAIRDKVNSMKFKTSVQQSILSMCLRPIEVKRKTMGHKYMLKIKYISSALLGHCL